MLGNSRNNRISLLLLGALCFWPLDGFKINRAIVASDANPMYLDFWPIVAEAWTKIVGVRPTLALIASKDVVVDETIGDVIRFEPIEGINTGFQAQVIRLLLPILFEDDVCLLSDIDMIPLSRSYFLNSVASIPNDHFVVYRDGAYPYEKFKFPMCYNAAKGSIFKEIFNVHSRDDIPRKIREWHALGYGWNTDEMVLGWEVKHWAKYATNCTLLGHGVARRIDRLDWRYDVSLLSRGYYIDSHSIRPYRTHKVAIDRLVEKTKILWKKH